MCLDCGCLRPPDDHNDPRHITAARLDLAAAANDRPAIEVARQIVATLEAPQNAVNKSFSDTANRPTVGFDIDDTCAKRVQALLAVLNTADDGMRRYAQVTSPAHKDLWPAQADLIRKAHETPGFYLNMSVSDSMRNLAWALKRAGFNIIIATKRDAFLKDVTMEWLKTHKFPEFDSYEFGNKSKYQANGKFGKDELVFIDDDPRNMFAFDGPTTKFFMPKRPWNAKLQGRPGYNVIDNLDPIYTMLGLASQESASGILP